MIKKTISSVLSAILLAAVVTPLAACNTMEGVGKDIQRGGQEIKEEAREHKK